MLRSRCCRAASANIFQLIKVSGRKRTLRFYLFLITARAQQYSNYRLRLLFRLGRQKLTTNTHTHTQTSPSESKLHQGGVGKLNDLCIRAHSAAAALVLNDSASEKNLIFHKSNFVLYTRGVIV